MDRIRNPRRAVAAMLAGMLAVSLAACIDDNVGEGGGEEDNVGEGGGEEDNVGEDEEEDTALRTKTLSGHVVDGPVEEAAVQVQDANGDFVTSGGRRVEATSGSDGRYSLEIPASVQTPLTVVATGGTDTGTGQEIQELRGMATEAEGTANITPTTTLIAEEALNRIDNGAATDRTPQQVVNVVRDHVMAVFDPEAEVYDKALNPLTGDLSGDNGDKVSRVEERVGATLRQVSGEYDRERALKAIAEDAADGTALGRDGDGNARDDELTARAQQIHEQVVHFQTVTNGEIPRFDEQNPVEVDAISDGSWEEPTVFRAGVGAYEFQDDGTQGNHLEVLGFGPDDCLSITGVERTSYSIRNIGADVELSYSGEAFNRIVLTGVVDDSDVVYDAHSLKNALDHDPFCEASGPD